MALSRMVAMATATATQPGASTVQDKMTQSFSFLDRINNHILDNSMDYIVAIILLIVGYNVAKWTKRFIITFMERGKYDRTVTIFFSQLMYYGILFLFLLSALNRLGVPSATFIAAIGAMGLAIGLALQNDLANFASGLLILIFKPFRVGDWIQISGSNDIAGRVEKIELLYTTIMTKENRAILTPNSKLTSNSIINSSYEDTRVIRFDIGIAYQNNHHEALAILKEIFHDNELILNKDSVEMGISSFSDNSVILSAYPRVSTEEVFTVYYAVMSEIKDRFDANGISMPFPQRDVYMHYPERPLSVRAEIVADKGDNPEPPVGKEELHK